MKITFRRDLSANYMVIENVEGFSEDDFMVKMLLKNRISHLLEFDYETMNGRVNLLYNISSRQAMIALFETEKISYETLRRFILSLENLIDTLGEYLLDINNVVLKKECIFMDLASESFSYCYNPYYNGDLKTELGIISDELLGAVDYEDQNAVRLVYALSRHCHEENFTLEALAELASQKQVQEESMPFADEEEYKYEPLRREAYVNEPEIGVSLPEAEPEKQKTGFLKKFSSYLKGKNIYDVVEDIDSGKIAAKIKESAPLSAGTGNRPQKEIYDYFGEDLLSYPRGDAPDEPKVRNVGLDEPFFEEIRLEEDNFEGNNSGETCLLSDFRENSRSLAGRGNLQGRIISINTYPFTIGKLKDRADALSTSSAVSRLHCRIHESGVSKDEYFFEDLNSKNGSYINGIRVNPYKKMPLRCGDIIRIADEEYEFR